MGFGFDAHGNFSAATEGRLLGPGRRRNSIAIRGPMGETRNDGYEYVFGTGSLDTFFSQNKQSRDDVTIHSAVISIAPDKTVSIAWTDKNGNWEKLVWEECDLPCPEQIMIGFTAGTGGSSANHEIRNLTVSSYEVNRTVWDGGSTQNSDWGSAINWVDDGSPVFGKTTDIEFNAVGAARLTNYLSETRTVRSLLFTTNITNDIVIRTTTTADGTQAATLVFASEGDGAAVQIRSGTTNNVTIGYAGGSIILSNNFFVAHNGGGILRFDRPITGDGGITKVGTGITVLNDANNYDGDTTLLAGTLKIGSGGTLGDQGNNLYLWDGKLDLGSTEQTKHTVELRNGVVTNGTLQFNSRLHYYEGVLEAELKGSGGVDKWQSDTVLVLKESNTYLGTTFVRAGTLMVENVSGSGTGSGSVTVYTTAVIGGRGRVGSDLIFSSGAKFVFSDSGPLHVDGDVSFNGFGIADLSGMGSSVTNGTYRQIQGGVVTNGLNNIGIEDVFYLDDTKYAYFDVVEDDLFLVVDNTPLSAAIDVSLYAVANGYVTIEIATVDENGAGDIVVSAWIDDDWVEIGRVPAEDVAGFGCGTYVLRTRKLEADKAYRLRIIDESGFTHYSNDPVKVHSVRMDKVRLDMQTITLTFATSLPGNYVIQGSSNLTDWSVEHVKHQMPDGNWSPLNDKPIFVGTNGTMVVRLPSGNRKQLFFRALRR